MRRQVWIVALLLLSFAPGIAADVPRQLSHQGVLMDSSRVIVPNGLYTIDFDIFDAPSAGSQLFHQQLQVNVVDGVYNVLLSDNGGSTMTLEEVFAYADTYLQLKIVGGPSGFPVPQALQPRQKLAAVPYAFSALGAGIVVATDSDSPVNMGVGTSTNGAITIPNVAPAITIPADGGVVIVRGRVTLRVSGGLSNGEASAIVSLRYDNGGGPTTCRQIELLWRDARSSIPVALDCIVENPSIGDTYVFTLHLDENLGNISYGDMYDNTGTGTSTDDTISIDAIWQSTR